MDRAAIYRTVRKPYIRGDSLLIKIEKIKVKLSAKSTVYHLHGEKHNTRTGNIKRKFIANVSVLLAFGVCVLTGKDGETKLFPSFPHTFSTPSSRTQNTSLPPFKR